MLSDLALLVSGPSLLGNTYLENSLHKWITTPASLNDCHTIRDQTIIALGLASCNYFFISVIVVQPVAVA